MKKFEYKIIDGSINTVKKDDEFVLNELGKEGWELISFIEGKAKNSGLGAKRLYYYFKREKNRKKRGKI